ncbi:MAG TPA: DUF4339 domain-containing protein [Tepidisphaeraceae bacterium]
MAEWHYIKDGQQLGPVSSAQLRDMVRGGELLPQDSIWREGMADWVPAQRVKGLFDASPAVAGVATAVAPEPVGVQSAPNPFIEQAQYPQASAVAPIGYYTPVEGMPARAARSLQKFAPVRGPVGEWPLADEYLQVLAQTEKYRKPIRGLATWFKICFVFAALGACATVIVAIALTGISRGGGIAMPLMFFVTSTAFYIGVACLFYVCGIATYRCKLWGAITMLVLHSLGAILYLGIFVAAITGAMFMPEGSSWTMLGFAIVLGIIVVFCIRAIISIKKFLAQPVWAVEALAYCKL